MFKLGAKSQKVDVFVLPRQKPNYRFDSEIWENGRLVFYNDGYDGFYVSFYLEDSNPQYYFAADKEDALAAKKIVVPEDACPDQGSQWSQFKAKEVSSDLRTLVVRNLNSKGQQCDFGFSLFVTTNDDGSGPYLKLDPIGENHNGATGFNWFSIAVTGVAVTAIAALALFAIQQFRASERE
jgi:hypothetical protein